LSLFYFLLFLPIAILSQTNSNRIQGRVITVDGMPVENVTVSLINQKNRVTTVVTSDSTGTFLIEKVTLQQRFTLLFEHVSYQPDSITNFLINSANEDNAVVMRLKLSEGRAALDEVVVVGYGTARRGDLTGAIASYKPKDAEAAISISVDQLLQGKLAGINVTNSITGGPGAASSVIIRGANSLRADNQPLYVIDNIPQASTAEFAGNAVGGGDNQVNENPLATLNPSDIEDIQVLKDASATAIYGSRGANGVIIITTKRGRSGKAKVSFGSNVTISQVRNTREMLGLRDYATFKNEQLAEFGVRSLIDTLGEVRLVTTGATYDPNDSSTFSIISEKNWQSAIYRNALTQNYNISISGGNDKTLYFISGSYKNIQGIVQQTGMQIGNFRANLNTNITDRLQMKLIINGALRKNLMMSGGDSRGSTTGSIVSAAAFAAPYAIPADDPVWSSSDPSAVDLRTSPLSWLQDYDDVSNEQKFGVSLELNWKISDAFSYTMRSGGNLSNQERNRWYGLQLFKGLNSNGYLGSSRLDQNNYTIENLLNFQKKIGNAKVTALAGTTYDAYKMTNELLSGQNFNYFDLRTNGMNFATVITPFSPIERPYQLISFLTRANLSILDDRYLATINFRADGSSKFALPNQWAYFPSLALAWRIEKESFMRSVEWVKQLKLRLGYGVVGNQNINPFSTLYAYAQGAGSYYASNGGNKVIAINVAGLPNPDIKWETTESYNLGLDFDLFQSRLSGSVDIYKKTTNDLLINRNLPPSSSFGSVIINQGSLQNKGFEVMLKTDVIRTDDLRFSFTGNLGYNRPQIKDLGLPLSTFGTLNNVAGYLGNAISDQFGIGNIFLKGYAPGLFYGYQTDGIYQTGDAITITKDLTNNVPKPGDVKFVDQNGDDIIDAKDLTIIGNPNSRFSYGFQPGFNFKQFSLTASFNGVWGNQILNANLRYEATPSRQVANIRKSSFNERWTASQPGDRYPSSYYNLPNVVLDRYIENGNFLRCSDLTLGYAVPARLLRKAKLSSVNVFASGKNLLLFTRYSGYDPEVNSFAFDGLRQGIDLFSYPNARSYTVGINIGL
jgi:TonB-linked SusC/RagA family outer membrane protein